MKLLNASLREVTDEDKLNQIALADDTDMNRSIHNTK